MGKWISILVSSIVGGAVAAATAFLVVQASTAAPSTNPASAQVVDYGTR